MSVITIVSRLAIAWWAKWPSGYLTCSPTEAQVPASGVQPREFSCALLISLSP
jgi:hypothetical protein